MERIVTRDTEQKQLTETIIQEVADVNQVTPREVEPRLYDVVDPDALASLFSAPRNGSERGEGYVQFTIDDVAVVVYASGKIIISPREEADFEKHNA